MFEYLVGRVQGDWTPEEEQQLLNKQGRLGWELVSVLRNEKTFPKETSFYFRRKLEA